MTPKFKNGKPLFKNGKPSFCCCGVCRYQVIAELLGPGSGITPLLFGSVDGSPTVYGGAQFWPVTAPHLMQWGSLPSGARLYSPGLVDPVALGGSHSYRFWWCQGDNGSPVDPVLATVTVTLITGEICVNGSTLNAGSTQLTIPVDQAPGDGDQSGYGDGTILEITCGACP